ncbi:MULTISPECIES: helix-turn-helix domain-containing protein [Bacillaceae]|uniref:Helix-turn-helix transcriptional regulator n=1 Tax=Bacillus norwichensis TaxID=2762217 RepID=A0ABR8VQN9_9BACI|nr:MULTISPECIES: helix-turn-helix transcriptional regulator [Bacillaceae]MBD8007075.1 helix-turn-helix transcriptional regulator [Bacillus norwichensis]
MKTNKNQKRILITIGNNIRKYRLKKGWSQEELAFECELHRTYIGAVERGERNITVLNLIKIKEKLDVKIGDLYPD